MMLCPVCNDVDTHGEPWMKIDDDRHVDDWWCSKCESTWIVVEGRIYEIQKGK